MTSVASLAAELEPDLSPEGVPARPLIIIPLERWRNAPPAAIADAARVVARALPVTAGVLEGPPSRALAPLIEAATLTLGATGAASEQAVVPLGDLGCDLARQPRGCAPPWHAHRGRRSPAVSWCARLLS